MPIRKAIRYPSTDSKGTAQSDTHFNVLGNTLCTLRSKFSSRDDVYVGGRTQVKYKVDATVKSLLTDCFVVFGVNNSMRAGYHVWKEGKYPDVVIEFTNLVTRRLDTVKKFSIYRDIWKVKEYFLFDVKSEYLFPSLQGFRLVNGAFNEIPLKNGRLNSEMLGLTIERERLLLAFRDNATGLQIQNHNYLLPNGHG